MRSRLPATSLRRVASKTLAEVCHHYDVHPDDVTGDERTPTIAFARFHWFFELRDRGLSYPEIARLVQRDHTTVMSGVRKFTIAAGVVT
jgi:chromosomal replication initiation ATPase DnaA